MKLLIPLAILTALSAADAASATPQTKPLPARVALARAVVVHRHGQPVRLTRARAYIVHHGMSPLALASVRASGRVVQPQADDGQVVPDADHPGWLKDKDHAGWGWSDGRTETVMGLYHRNPRPDFIPNGDLIQGGRGAAGVAVSLKLGG